MCPDPTFTLASNKCYIANYYKHWFSFAYDAARANCLIADRQGVSSTLLIIKSQEEQNIIERVIESSKARKALNTYTGLRVQKKTFPNGTTVWLDDKNIRLQYTNFADNQNPAGIACVVIARRLNYKWVTVRCGYGTATAVACVSEQGTEEQVFIALTGRRPIGSTANYCPLVVSLGAFPLYFLLLLLKSLRCLKYLHAVRICERSLPGLTPHSHLAGFCIIIITQWGT